MVKNDYKLFANNMSKTERVLIPNKKENTTGWSLLDLDLATLQFIDDNDLETYLFSGGLPRGNYHFTIEKQTEGNTSVLDVAFSNSPFLAQIARKIKSSGQELSKLPYKDPLTIKFYNWLIKKLEDRSFREYMETSKYIRSEIKKMIDDWKRNKPEAFNRVMLANYKIMRGIIVGFVEFSKIEISSHSYPTFPDSEMEHIFQALDVEGLLNYYPLDTLVSRLDQNTLNILGVAPEQPLKPDKIATM